MKPKFYTIQVPDSFSKEGQHKLAITEWGDSTNPNILVCVHGLTRNARDFDYIAQSMASHYRVICPDMPGRGRSPWLPDKAHYNYGTYIADTLSMMDKLAITQCDWLGTSMGGLIGMMIGAEFPALIRKMVINDIGPFIPGKALRRIRKYVAITPHFDDLDAAETHLRTILTAFGIKKPEHWQHITLHSTQKHPEGGYKLAYDPQIAYALGEIDELDDVDLWPVWNQLVHPRLVLRGSISDTLLSDTANQMQEHPDVTLVEFDLIGHAPTLMDTHQITPIRDWLL